VFGIIPSYFMRLIELTFKLKKPILACGADMKGAFALGFGEQVFLYEGFGDLSDPDNLARYRKAIIGALKTTRIKPAIVACDMHPGYFPTRFAENYRKIGMKKNLKTRSFGSPLRGSPQDDRENRPLSLFSIQHHEAHIASVMVDNAIKGDCVGVAFDGTGYGIDGNIWGGEFFAGNLKGFKRADHLKYVPMPGGDAAIRQPWRMVVSYLYTSRHFEAAKRPKNLGSLDPSRCFASLRMTREGSPQNDNKVSQTPFIIKMIEKKINSPLTSSAGRLFDAAASLVLGKDNADFEAELPIAFEKIADRNCGESYGAVLPSASAEIIKRVAADVGRKVDSGVISARFHNTVAGMVVRTAKSLCRQYRTKKIVLSGGVFQNKFLSGKTADMLRGGGFSVYTHKNISTTDSGIPVGQIAIANARFLCA